MVKREVASKDKKSSYWLCKCDCGNESVTRGTDLKSGITQSCGCLAKEIAKEVGKGAIKQVHESYNRKRIDGVATFLINDRLQKNNKTGYNGVQQYKLADGSVRYKAYLTVNKKTHSKKGFRTALEAYNYRLSLVDRYVPKGGKNEI